MLNNLPIGHHGHNSEIRIRLPKKSTTSEALPHDTQLNEERG